MPISQDKLDLWLGSQSLPCAPQCREAGAQEIRVAARLLAEAILDHTPPSADQSHAIRLTREAMVWAVQAIAHDGKYRAEPGGSSKATPTVRRRSWPSRTPRKSQR